MIDRPPFYYTALLKADESGVESSVLAYQTVGGGTLRAVMWSGRRKMWMYAPAIVGAYLYDDDYSDRTRLIDRAEAERIARDVLRVELPSEEVLMGMCDEGQRMGWRTGPPQG